MSAPAPKPRWLRVLEYIGFIIYLLWFLTPDGGFLPPRY